MKTPRFSQKHYEAIAFTLSATKPDILRHGQTYDNASAQWVTDVWQFAFMFEKDNPRFDRVRFQDACRLHGALQWKAPNTKAETGYNETIQDLGFNL